MSKKVQWKLTENGVLALYEQHFKKEVKVQVIFKTQVDTTCYLRVSDGRHLSPVVIMVINKLVLSTSFCVGAVIAIKERQLVSFEEYAKNGNRQISLEDRLHQVIILSFSVVGTDDDVDCVLGSLNRQSPYQDDLKLVLATVGTWNRRKEQVSMELELYENLKSEEEGNALREEGNKYFKQENFTQALCYYDRAKSKFPYDYRVWSNYSHALYKIEEFLEAELHAIVAMKMNPFSEKAYYRAGLAAIREGRRHMGEVYAGNGLFLCTESKELRQILEEAATIPYDNYFNENEGYSDLFSGMVSDSIQDVMEQADSFINWKSLDWNKSCHKHHSTTVTQDHVVKKKYIEISSSFGWDKEREPKKVVKKSKKPSEEVTAAIAAAAAINREPKKSKEEEDRKHVQELKKENKSYKLKINLNQALEEGRRLYQSEQFHQAIEMYNKCLTYKELKDNSNNVKVKSNERYDVQVIHFIIAICKVSSGRGYVFEGLETMKALSGDNNKFCNKPAARYWLAVSFDKICCFKLAQKHAQLCKEALKKIKSYKPVKWPGTDELINCTRADILEEMCKRLLDKPPSPKAKCRLKNCITTQGIPYAKEQIYLMDPDFKGYLNVICEENCTVSYHPCCWKAVKEQRGGSVNRLSDKDFLGRACVTPDCNGKITSIRIYDDVGELKNELVKDKKDRKHMAAPVKQKKKKDKKKEKTQAHKKRTRMESVCEDQTNSEEPSPLTGESTSTQSTTTTGNTNNNNNSNDKRKSHPMPVLPIDPESLEKAQVTILKPGAEADALSPPKSTKNKKKKKTKKPVNQPNLLGDPLEADLCAQNEYIARLRVLRQQRDALEAGENPNAMKPITFTNDTHKPVLLLDPDNPFYLPQHLRDNPEELENVLQDKLTTSSPPGLEQETISTLLDFMYDWLKSEGPMSISDPRLAQQVAESFPQEARDYVTQCGGITGLLMQSIKFAMIDSIVCVYDDVVKAQEMMCWEVNDKMTQSKYLVRYSDGQKAKRFTHLLDDAKSTCSTTSNLSQLAESATSCISKDSAAAAATRRHHRNTRNDTNNNNDDDDDDDDDESGPSLAPLSKRIVHQFHSVDCRLNPSASEFMPAETNDEEGEEEDDDEEEEEEEEGERQCRKDDNCKYIENWAAQAGKKVPLTPEEEEEEVREGEEERTESIQDDEDLEEEEMEGDEDDEERAKLLQEVEDDMEQTQQYISQLLDEKDSLTADLEHEQQQNQVLNDKLYQVKSQYKSEVMKLKQQLEELRDQNKEVSAEKNALLLQKDTDAKKHKSDLSRLTEEMKNVQSRLQSSELKKERCLDHNNELQAKMVEEIELNTQLREELAKMKDLQDSLTSCSRRAREAEVKYLSTKKDLVDAGMTRTIRRLTEEANAMRKLLPRVTSASVPDRTTLTRTIVAWDEAVKNLLEQQGMFLEEGTRLMGMIHQGRPLSALPVGDLPVPVIPCLTIAPMLTLFQNNHKSSPEPLPKDPPRHPSPGPGMPRHPSPGPGPGMLRHPSPGHGILKLPLMSEPPPQVPAMCAQIPLIKNAPPPLVMQNGAPPPPNHPSAYASGAIPKAAAAAAAALSSDNPSQTELTNQLFVGQLPWEYSDMDVKNLFSQFGEVVSVNVFDKGCNADGRPVPKYGFITFRNADHCSLALAARPIYVRNHMLNVQAKEAKPAKPASVPATGGGGGVVGGGGGGTGSTGAGGGGGLASIINELDATNGTKSSAYGLTDITINANVEANKSAAAQHHLLPTPPTPLHHQPPPPTTTATTQSVTKPKFQRLVPTNNTVGGITAPPPKLVRPQHKTQPNTSKLGSQSGAAKEENGMPSSSSYSRLIETCKQRFGKEFSSPDICTAVREVRFQNSNTLSGLNTDKIVERVRQQLRSRRPSAGTAKVAPWAGLTQGQGVKTGPEWQGPSKEEVVKEETCSICLEPLNTSPNQSLACLHTFHALCINDWIKIQSNCPNCRKFALMPDEYPTLS